MPGSAYEPAPGSSIRVFVADHHAVVRDGLRRLFADAPDIEFAGETGSVRELLDLAREASWDAVVLDFASDEMGGIDGLRRLRALRPTLPIVVLSMHPESQYSVPVLKVGALAYLSKGRSSSELIDAIRAAAQGRRYLTSEAVEAFFVEAPPAAPAADPGPAAARSNLPRVSGRLFGRDQDLARLAEACSGASGVVSVVGPPGTGKTLLVQHYAASRLAGFPGGVLWCDVTEATSLEGIHAVVARALELELRGGDPSAQIARALAARGAVLVVLDNVEQVILASSSALAAWARQAPEARFITTTREALRIDGEAVVQLEPLELPEGGDLAALAANPAVALFTERARAVAPGFALSDANAADVCALLRLLDGLPLAIELAAARACVLPLASIIARLSQGFDLLRGERRDVHARQATLRRAFDWSWGLLEPYERAVLAQSTVFCGGFRLDATEAVLDLSRWPGAPMVIDVVQALLNKSLLRVARQQRAAEPSFALLQSVAAYAAEKLRDPSAIAGEDGAPASGPGAARAAEDRHAAHFASYGGDASLDALVAQGGEARQVKLFEQAENISAALDRAIAAQRGEQAVRCCLALGEILGRRGPFSSMEPRLTATLAIPGHHPRACGLSSCSWTRAARSRRATGRAPRARRPPRWRSPASSTTRGSRGRPSSRARAGAPSATTWPARARSQRQA
jgi:predicted ATPase/DNA-binding NarL/FixJ family response regulator